MKSICLGLILVFVVVVECRFFPLDQSVCDLSHSDKHQFGICYHRSLPGNTQRFFGIIQSCMANLFRVNDYAYFIHYSECLNDPRITKELTKCLEDNSDYRRMMEEVAHYWSSLHDISRKCVRYVQGDQ